MLFIFYFGTPLATFPLLSLSLSLSLSLYLSLCSLSTAALLLFATAAAAVMFLAVSQRTFCLVFSNNNSNNSVVTCACVCVCVAAALRQAIIQSRVQFGGCTHTHTHTPFAKNTEDTCDALALSLRTFCQTIRLSVHHCTSAQWSSQVKKYI